MNNITIGLDIAKTNFHLVRVRADGKEVSRKALKREQVLEYFANLEVCRVALEACGGSNYWGRKLSDMGHEVKIIPAAKVKPYLLKQKNDFNDATAIAEAASRDCVKWLSPARVEQQDLQNVLRVRDRLVKHTTAISNQIRGLLMEYGIVSKRGHYSLLKLLDSILESDVNAERALWKLIFKDLRKDLKRNIAHIAKYDKLIIKLAKGHEECKRLQELPGVGPVTSLAIVSSVNNINDFKNGRQFSAWLGLVPKQHSSGGKTKLLGITKRGDKFTRRLLVHGGRVLTQFVSKEKNEWLYHVKARRGFNKASVAQANKTARRIYAVLKYGDKYDPQR